MLQALWHREVGIPGQNVALDSKIFDLRHIAQSIVEAALDDIINETQHIGKGQCALGLHIDPMPLDNLFVFEILLRNLVE